MGLEVVPATAVVWSVIFPISSSFLFFGRTPSARHVSRSVCRWWIVWHGGRGCRSRKTTRPRHRLFALQDTLLESLGNVVIPRQSCRHDAHYCRLAGLAGCAPSVCPLTTTTAFEAPFRVVSLSGSLKPPSPSPPLSPSAIISSRTFPATRWSLIVSEKVRKSGYTVSLCTLGASFAILTCCCGCEIRTRWH